jgi:thiamine biosynthesis lipoprotein
MKFSVVSLLFILIPLLSCKNKSEKELFANIRGFTQGSTYSITFENLSATDPSKIQNAVEQIFSSVDLSLSVYNDSSVISRVNRNETDKTDRFLEEVLVMSKKISVLTNGAFDVTVGPLVKAWGFGPDGRRSADTATIKGLLNLVGYSKLSVRDGRVYKADKAIVIDVNAIAQGYTVDIVYSYLESLGIKNFLIEVGGEVRVKGMHTDRPWKIGIDKPTDNNDSPGSDLQTIIRLHDRALATSGNYRKFYIEDGIRYSHTIDPFTGFPAKNSLLSATIIAKDCATADALATACMVMGTPRAKELIMSLKGVDAYFISSGKGQSYDIWMTDGLKELIEE